ncbi:MAG: hypothetical protein JWM80_252 [Cyanobacteria bacterium RYN_339]|nr:hypothetical protein [Cyanobacteria bacterium RYN_339]
MRAWLVAAILVLASALPCRGPAAAAAVNALGTGEAPPAFGSTLRHGFQWGNVDNLRFGLTQFQDAQTAALFAGRQGISLGCDYNIGSGFAVGLDSVALYKNFDGVGYFLSVNPVQLKYRAGLPFGNPAQMLPYVTVGAGATFMGMLADSTPRFGMGYAGSAGLGMLINDGLTVELGYGGGRVGNVTDYGVQMRLGTAFDTLGDLPFWSWRANARAQAPAGGGGGGEALAGTVEGVIGDRLALQLPPNLPLPEGRDVLIYVEEGITIKVARARIETLGEQGRAVAVILQTMEPIKPGYRVRAW